MQDGRDPPAHDHDDLELHRGPRGEHLNVVRGALAAAGLSVDALLDPAAHGGRVLKENPRRCVFELPSADGAWIVKHYRVAGTADAVKALVGRDRAEREWATATALRREGFLVPEPLARGSRTIRGRREWSLFALRAVPGAVPLGGFLEARFRPGDGAGERKGRWVRRAADLLAALHARGFDHRDFHGGNLLVERGNEGDGGPLHVIDLHRVVRGSRVATRRRVLALADLLHTLRHALDRADDDDAVAAYVLAAGRPVAEVARWRAAVAHALRRRERRRLASRSRRATRESSGFAAVRCGGVRGFRRREVDETTLFAAIASARAAIAAGGAAARALGRRSAVAIAAAGGAAFAVKVYEGDGRRSPRGRWTQGRGGRAYEAGHALLVRGLPVPRVVAWLKTPDRSIVVMDAVEGAEPLSVLSFRVGAGGDLEERAGELADAVAELLVAVFSSDVRANDLSPKNLMVRIDADGARAWLVDFDGITFGRPPLREQILRGLSQVNDVAPSVPARVRLRVLRRLRRDVPACRGRDVARDVRARTRARATRTIGAPSPDAVRGAP